jgi:hypothetical protein
MCPRNVVETYPVRCSDRVAHNANSPRKGKKNTRWLKTADKHNVPTSHTHTHTHTHTLTHTYTHIHTQALISRIRTVQIVREFDVDPAINSGQNPAWTCHGLLKESVARIRDGEQAHDQKVPGAKARAKEEKKRKKKRKERKRERKSQTDNNINSDT